VGRMWRLADLVELANRVLPYEEEGESRRVQWAPNERLVRYYTTLGILDRPAEMRGRTAYYDTRHLLQLLAIKRLQLDGMTLRAVQEYLTGLPDAALEEAAALPPGWRAALDTTPPAEGAAPAEAVALLEATAPVAAPPPPAAPAPFWARAPRGAEPPPPATAPATTLSGVVLAPEVILLLKPEVLNLIDPDELRRAAEPLLKLIGPVSGPQA
jgi:hypothetical protein